MKIKIRKLHDDAVIPTKAHASDAGYDLTAVTSFDDEYGNKVYDTKLAMEIPSGYAGFIFPRSSISKTTLALSNSVGVIDSTYRGSIMVKFKPTVYYGFREADDPLEYNDGERVGQLIILPIPEVEFEQTDNLSTTERNTGGFGSTGR